VLGEILDLPAAGYVLALPHPPGAGGALMTYRGPRRDAKHRVSLIGATHLTRRPIPCQQSRETPWEASFCSTTKMSSRAAGKNKREKLAQLAALRKQGKKTFDAYEVADADDLYEEVDDTQYKKILRDRLDQDDFVVDDNGEGYADDGREEWDREPVYESDSENDGAKVVRGKDRKCTPGVPSLFSSQ